MIEPQRRARDTGPARAGSRLQLQLWVNDHHEQLNRSLADQIPALAQTEISWTSPLADDPAGAYAEYQDVNFLDAIGRRDQAAQLAGYWPQGGPVWDGLATTRGPEGPGALLVEAKAHVPEILAGSPCGAEAPDSIRKIDSALEETRDALHATGEPAAWKGPLYQTANRLAHLHFLRARGVDAIFMHLLFVGDATLTPTTRVQFEAALETISSELGLPDNVPNAFHAFVPAIEKPSNWAG